MTRFRDRILVEGFEPVCDVGTASSTLEVAGFALLALIHGLGSHDRFPDTLRVFKPISPTSVGSWLPAGFAPAVTAATPGDVTGFPRHRQMVKR